MDILKLANLAFRFLLELCLLAAVGYWGFSAAGPLIAKIALGIGLAILVAAVWGVFLSPRRSVQLPVTARLVMEVILFALAVAALAVTGQSALAATLAVAYAINRILILAWKQE
jgi:hypothetical protein